jgi:methionine salvage enolase-phosphatase E1
VWFTKDVKRRRAHTRKKNIVFNLYAETKIAEQRRAELERQAEHERQIAKLIRWIKQDKRDEAAKQMQAQAPEVMVYEN